MITKEEKLPIGLNVEDFHEFLINNGFRNINSVNQLFIKLSYPMVVGGVRPRTDFVYIDDGEFQFSGSEEAYELITDFLEGNISLNESAVVEECSWLVRGIKSWLMFKQYLVEKEDFIKSVVPINCLSTMYESGEFAQVVKNTSVTNIFSAKIIDKDTELLVINFSGDVNYANELIEGFKTLNPSIKVTKKEV